LFPFTQNSSAVPIGLPSMVKVTWLPATTTAPATFCVSALVSRHEQPWATVPAQIQFAGGLLGSALVLRQASCRVAQSRLGMLSRATARQAGV
jgi:hypothetical protein